MGRPVPEEDFAFVEAVTSGQAQKDPEDAETQFEDELIAQYRGQKPPEASKIDEADLEDATEVDRFLSGKKLYLNGLESETEVDMVDWITEAGGEVVNMDFNGIIDYLVVGLSHNLDNAKNSSMQPQEIVTYLWLEDCFDSGNFVEFKHFHRPITIDPKLRPCEGVVIGITNYVGRERQYITSLAEALGE